MRLEELMANVPQQWLIFKLVRLQMPVNEYTLERWCDKMTNQQIQSKPGDLTRLLTERIDEVEQATDGTFGSHNFWVFI